MSVEVFMKYFLRKWTLWQNELYIDIYVLCNAYIHIDAQYNMMSCKFWSNIRYVVAIFVNQRKKLYIAEQNKVLQKRFM